jgi:hypothetical protein
MSAENQSTSDQSAKPRPKLRWYQYSLRTLLICSFIFALAQTQKEIVERWSNAGSSIHYYSWSGSFSHGYSDVACPYPDWLRSLVGDDFLSNVLFLGYVSSESDPKHIDNDFALVERFDHLKGIIIEADISDEGIAPIKTL